MPVDQPRIGLVAKNSVDYVEQFFQHLARGVVVVPVRSPDDRYRIDACGLTTIVTPGDGGGWFSGPLRLPADDDLAQIAFTSGTEGEPKGVLLTHANLADATDRIQSRMRMDASTREYVGVPVYHSFGLGRCRAVAAAGGRVYVPAGGFNLLELSQMLARDEINAVSAVPSLWRLVLKRRDLFAPNAHGVRWIEIGSQPMSGDEKRALRSLFPRACIVQHYGLTEASRSTFLDVGSATDAQLDSVGQPNGEVEVAIGPDGRIRIRGPHVARELLVGGHRVANVDADGWFQTNDLGELRGGVLYFRGRADDVINIGGIKVSPDAIEAAMRAALGVETGFCVARTTDALRGDSVLVAARRDLERSDAQLLDAADRGLSALGVDARGAIAVARLDALPATESGKVQRKVVASQYAQNLEKRAAAASRDPATGAAATGGGYLSPWAWLRRRRPRSVRAVYGVVFPGKDVSEDDSFVGLGGDSLSFVEASARLEELLGVLPKDWPTMTIRQLEGIQPRRAARVPVEMSLMLRFLAIVGIVCYHFELLDVGGGTYLLLAIAGFSFSRFQLQTVLGTGDVRPLLATATRIAIPTLLAIWLHQLKTHDYHLPQLVLLGNWENAADQAFSYWFLELLVQLYLIVALLMAVPAVQAWGRANAKGLAVGGLAVAVLFAIVGPHVWDAEHLAQRVPHMMIWLFFLGWVVQQSETTADKVIASLAAIALPLVIWIDHLGVVWLAHGEIWVMAGCLLLLFVKEVALPRVAYRVITLVADASMFIYLVHWTARTYWHRAGAPHSRLLDVLVGIVAGIAVGWLWKAGIRLLRRQRMHDVRGDRAASTVL